MDNIIFEVDALHDMMITWRHDFHMYPELACQETLTAEMVAGLLRKFKIEVHTGVGGTGVVGVLKRGDGSRSIGLRADMDALSIHEESTFAHRSRHEGRMHACGHDGHMAMLLGAARHLATVGNFDGTVYFIFQPGEEPGLGARAMLNDGLFERFPADSIYGMHNMPSLPVGTFAVRAGPVMACEDHFEIVISGRGAHSAMPHRGVDPIMIGSQVVLALQSVVSRVLDPVDNAVISVTEFITEGARNIIPGKVVLRGDTRSFLPSVRQRIEMAITRIANGICAAHGADCDVSYKHEFMATINSSNEAQKAADIARQIVGDANVDLHCPPFMASEDFGILLDAKPGCFLFIGNGEPDVDNCGLHNPGYDFNDKNLTIGAEFWIRLVEDQIPARI